jgi:hypothetical protein
VGASESELDRIAIEFPGATRAEAAIIAQEVDKMEDEDLGGDANLQDARLPQNRA